MRRRLTIGALSVLAVAALPLMGWAATGPGVTLLTPTSESVHKGVVSITWSYSGFHPSTPVDVQVRRGAGAYQLVARVAIDNGTPGYFGSTSWSTGAADDGTDWTIRLSVPTNKAVSSTVSPVTVDNTAPVPILVDRTAANDAGWNNEDVTVTWACEDAASGAVEPTVSATVSAEGAGQSASATCEDRAGHTATATEGGINVDRTPGTVAIDVDPVGRDEGPTMAVDAPITGTAEDGLSGVGSVAVTFTNVAGGTETTRDAECTGCGTGSATWSVPTAGLVPGVYTVSAVATDVADNDSAPAVATFVVIAQPTVTPPDVVALITTIVETLPDPNEVIEEIVGTLPDPDDVIGTLPDPTTLVDPSTLPDPTTLVDPSTVPDPNDVIETVPDPTTLVDPSTLPDPVALLTELIGTLPIIGD
ncbi:MAG: hypothetical protein M3394_04330 [Actinomycetota bacterium]|nr:hypothetical protein [Actinomycetota bacterium]